MDETLGRVKNKKKHEKLNMYECQCKAKQRKMENESLNEKHGCHNVSCKN